MINRINKNYWFVIINVGTSAFSFVRSFVFMKELGLIELGTISLIQTIMMLLSLLHFGLINGGYRLYALDREDENLKLNDTFFSFIGMLFVFLIFLFTTNVLFGWFKELNSFLFLYSILIGVLGLINNWLTNSLIGKQKIEMINRLNIISNIISFLFIPSIFLWNMYGALLVIAIQPISFFLFCYHWNKDSHPRKFSFSLKYMKYILHFGFIPFLSGIFGTLILQIERWTILDSFGSEGLGKFYLVFLYCSLFLLFPSSINNLFFPKAIKLYTTKDYLHFGILMKKYIWILIGYNVFVYFMSYAFLQSIINVYFSLHSDYVGLIFNALPGLVLTSMIAPIGLLLNSAVILKPMLFMDLVALTSCICILLCLKINTFLSLESIALTRTCVGIITFIGYVLIYFYLKRKRLFYVAKTN